MFHNSTHRKHWLFSSLSEVDKLRQTCLENYTTKSAIDGDVITLHEHKILCKYYEKQLFHLCQGFQPPLPYSVLFTSFVYFKRIYTQTSILENIPNDMISVCLYLACKVEEYNVSVDKFVMIYPEESRFDIADVILSNEMNLMQLLNYQLIVHSPKRALEGFFIDIKTRFPQKEDVDKCRDIASEFLNAVLFTDAVFLYTPSQIALAALFAASKNVVRNYVLSVLAPGLQGQGLLKKVEDIIKLINTKLVYEERQVKKILEKINAGKTKKRKPGSRNNESAKRLKASEVPDDDVISVDWQDE